MSPGSKEPDGDLGAAIGLGYGVRWAPRSETWMQYWGLDLVGQLAFDDQGAWPKVEAVVSVTPRTTLFALGIGYRFDPVLERGTVRDEGIVLSVRLMQWAGGPSRPKLVLPRVPAPLPRPDLVIESFRHEPPLPRSDDAISAVAVIANRGDATARPSTLEIRHDSDVRGPRHDLPALAPGATVVVRMAIEPLVRDYALHAHTDVTGQVEERDELNNVADQVFSVRPPAPDLTVSVAVSPRSPRPRHQMTLHAVVRNVGTVASAPTQVRVRIDDDPAGTLLDVPSTEPGRTVVLAAPFVPPLRGTYKLSATVDAAHELDERSETNNDSELDFHTITRNTVLLELFGPGILSLNYERLFGDWLAVRAGAGGLGSEGGPAIYTLPFTAAYYREARVAGRQWALDAGGGVVVTHATDAIGAYPRGLAVTAVGVVGLRYIGEAVVFRIAYTPLLGRGGFENMFGFAAGATWSL